MWPTKETYMHWRTHFHWVIAFVFGSKFGKKFFDDDSIWNPLIDIFKHFSKIMHWKSNVVWSGVLCKPNESTLYGYEHYHRFIFHYAISTLLTPNVLWQDGCKSSLLAMIL
jgi:hypothetical protein